MSTQLSNGLLGRRRRANPNVPPVNQVAPAISGTAALGQTLTASTGTWQGTLPISYSYQWRRDGSAISGATGSTWVVAAADQGTTLTVTVTASNPAGSASATSAGMAIPIPMELTLTSITAVVNAATVTIPTSAQVGDIAVFAQFAYNSGGAPGTVEFPGATTVVNGLAANLNNGRIMCSYKVLTAGDINVALAGMTGSVQQKTVRIIRPSRAVSSITHGSPFTWSGTSASLHTINASPVAPAFVFGRVLNTQSALTVQGSLPSSGNRLDESLGVNYRTYLEIQNTTLSARTIGPSNSTGLLAVQGFYAYVT